MITDRHNITNIIFRFRFSWFLGIWYVNYPAQLLGIFVIDTFGSTLVVLFGVLFIPSTILSITSTHRFLFYRFLYRFLYRLHLPISLSISLSITSTHRFFILVKISIEPFFYCTISSFHYTCMYIDGINCIFLFSVCLEILEL